MGKYALTETFESLMGIVIPERGQNAMVRCFLHEDSRPSLSLDLDRGLWICFSCGERGSVFKMARMLDRTIDDTDILLRTYESAQSNAIIDYPDFTDLAMSFHKTAWTNQPKGIVDYITSRNLSPKVFRKFKLGINGDRISMPYFDDDKVIAIKYRSVLDGAKSAEKGSRRFLYNVNDARGKETVIICEGESDTHAVWTALDKRPQLWHTIGVVGVPGASLSRPTWELFSLELLWAKQIYVAFDADDAGDKGAAQVISILGDRALRLRPTKGKDVDLHIRNGGSLAEIGFRSDSDNFVSKEDGN